MTFFHFSTLYVFVPNEKPKKQNRKKPDHTQHSLPSRVTMDLSRVTMDRSRVTMDRSRVRMDRSRVTMDLLLKYRERARSAPSRSMRRLYKFMEIES